MAKSKLHIGIMFMTERVGNIVPRFRIIGNHELLLLDGREIDKSRYPKLSQLLERGGYGDNLPNEYQEEDIQDCYIVARRLSSKEIRYMKNQRKQKGIAKK